MTKQLMEELLYEYSDLFQLKMKEAEIEEHLRLCNYCNLPSYAMCNEIKLKQIELTNLKSKIKEIK